LYAYCHVVPVSVSRLTFAALRDVRSAAFYAQEDLSATVSGSRALPLRALLLARILGGKASFAFAAGSAVRAEVQDASLPLLPCPVKRSVLPASGLLPLPRYHHSRARMRT